MSGLGVLMWTVGVFVVLALAWFMLSSCLGEPLRRLGKLWWENALEAARMERAKNPHERWPGDGPGEAFEMDTRRRR